MLAVFKLASGSSVVVFGPPCSSLIRQGSELRAGAAAFGGGGSTLGCAVPRWDLKTGP